MTEPNGPRKRTAVRPAGAPRSDGEPAKVEAGKAPAAKVQAAKVQAAKVQAAKAPAAKVQAGKAPAAVGRWANGASEARGADAGGGEARRAGRSGPEMVQAGWWPKRLRQAVIALLILGVCGFLIDGADRPRDPYLVRTPGSSSGTAQMSFPSVSLTVDTVGGSRRSACVLEAETVDQQEHGLMGRTSLGRYAGMVFVFPAPTTVRFYMKDTLIPLSLAWFDARGAFIGSTEMPPCRTAVCPTYGAPRAFNSALEVPAGQLHSLGIGPGSVVALGASCG